jgi:hypothetical protein
MSANYRHPVLVAFPQANMAVLNPEVKIRVSRNRGNGNSWGLAVYISVSYSFFLQSRCRSGVSSTDYIVDRSENRDKTIFTLIEMLPEVRVHLDLLLIFLRLLNKYDRF